MTARPAGPALIAGRPRMCAENDRRCRWTRTERPIVANVCKKRQNMSLDAQIGEVPRAGGGVFKRAVDPVTLLKQDPGTLLPDLCTPQSVLPVATRSAEHAALVRHQVA